MDEGYRKFKAVFVKEKKIPDDIIKSLNRYRKQMYDRNLIGEITVDGKEIGFGNISERSKKGFIVSGTNTGNFKNLKACQYSEIVRCDYEKNTVWYEGQKDPGPSSESMTHYAVYTSSKDVNAVIHVHNKKMWQNMKSIVPSTGAFALFGTPELAKEVKRMFKESPVKEKKVFTLRGHTDGIISFGKDLKEAAGVMVKYYNKFGKRLSKNI